MSCSRPAAACLHASVRFLAPVEPSKIIATHLTYRSRVEEYGARTPPSRPTS